MISKTQPKITILLSQLPPMPPDSWVLSHWYQFTVQVRDQFFIWKYGMLLKRRNTCVSGSGHSCYWPPEWTEPVSSTEKTSPIWLASLFSCKYFFSVFFDAKKFFIASHKCPSLKEVMPFLAMRCLHFLTSLLSGLSFHTSHTAILDLVAPRVRPFRLEKKAVWLRRRLSSHFFLEPFS